MVNHSPKNASKRPRSNDDSAESMAVERISELSVSEFRTLIAEVIHSNIAELSTKDDLAVSNRKIATLEKENCDLKLQLVKIQNTMDQLLDKVTEHLQISRPVHQQQDRMNSQNQNVLDMPKSYAAIVGTGVDDSIVTVPVKNFEFIHLSHIDRNTSVETVKAYVKNTFDLRDEDVRCWSLVPKNRDITTLNFISFKIGLPEGTTDVHLTHMWPKGSVVKPFVNRTSSKNGQQATFPQGTS